MNNKAGESIFWLREATQIQFAKLVKMTNNTGLQETELV